MLPASLHQPVDHMEWADAIFWSAALSLPQAHEDARVQELLHHIHTVQHVYLQLWRDEPLDVPERASFADLTAMLPWARSFYAGARDVLTALHDDELQRPVHVPWAAQLTERYGVVHPATLAESILQVVLHTAHHRGQLCTRLREIGGEPPLLDFVAWVWQGKPAPAWPTVAAS